MLLYVDKKKQKRQKIKILCFIFTFIFIVLANIIHYKNSIHKTQNSLASYKNITTTHSWFDKSDSINIFTKKNKQTPFVIITPQEITRENAEILAYALSKITPKSTIKLSTNIANNQILQNLIKHFELVLSQANTSNLLVTDNLNEAEELIHKEKLHPTFLTYQKANNDTKTNKLLNTLFPLPAKPDTTLEKEIASLKEFTAIYKQDIINSLLPNNKHSFTTHGFFLKNANVCITYQTYKICEINNDTSLEKNIKKLIENTVGNNISQIHLLTSYKEIHTTDTLEDNEGIIFEFEDRKEILLPYEIKEISKTDTPFYIIKNKMGINPDYTSDKMKYFKFKTLEIELNDKI